MIDTRTAAAALSAAAIKLRSVTAAMQDVRALGVDEATDESLAATISRIEAEASALELEADILAIDARWTRAQRRLGLTVPVIQENIQ